jgi:hypothetical protein
MKAPKHQTGLAKKINITEHLLPCSKLEFLLTHFFLILFIIFWKSLMISQLILLIPGPLKSIRKFKNEQSECITRSFKYHSILKPHLNSV